jgi:hypothetical protein
MIMAVTRTRDHDPRSESPAIASRIPSRAGMVTITIPDPSQTRAGQWLRARDSEVERGRRRTLCQELKTGPTARGLVAGLTTYHARFDHLGTRCSPERPVAPCSKIIAP